MTESDVTGELTAMLKRAITAGKSGVVPLADGVRKIRASNYVDPDRYKLELERIFRRVPLLLAMTVELPNPGDFKTIDAAGVPVLLSRQKDGGVRAFVNSCTHRGTRITTEPSGNARRFTCPYHGWMFSHDGGLAAVASAEEFGPIDRSCYSLTSLPVAERAGLIWVCLDGKSTLDIDAFLSGYDALLARFAFRDWRLFAKQELTGPNWKVAYDGYLDFYHVAVLHKATIGAGLGNQAIYTAWGPHQRVAAPARDFAELEAIPEKDWPDHVLMRGVWTIFPHVSISPFSIGNRTMIMLSQLFPGETVEDSVTWQYFLAPRECDEAWDGKALAMVDLLRRVVEDEDYYTGRLLQRSLRAGALDDVTFGRNEGGGQTFHGWVDRLLATSDDDLHGLFAQSTKAYVGESRDAA